MKNDEEILASLIVGGLIGGALGALLSEKKNEGEGAALGALAGAVVLATFKASEQAKQTNLPMYFVENGYLYQVQPGGTKKLIRQIHKPSTTVQEHFRLK
jgi:hypothetical protein